MKKILCDCGKVAVWCYIPGYLEGDNPYSCDDCVPRGCSCNHYYTNPEAYHPPEGTGIHPTKEDEPIQWVDKNTWCHVDDKGREFPCVEYDYDENGYETEDDKG